MENDAVFVKLRDVHCEPCYPLTRIDKVISVSVFFYLFCLVHYMVVIKTREWENFSIFPLAS
jgi:hypothetical protein